VRRVLVLRLRSIGDTVLSTPALHCLRRFLPTARIDVVLEDWVAPLLAGSSDVDDVLSLPRRGLAGRARLVRLLRQRRYDVAVNLHGGTTATLLAFAAGVPRRIGYRRYQYSALLTHRLRPSTQLWNQAEVHSVEEQLALLGGVGVPVTDRPRTRLAVSEAARAVVLRRLAAAGLAPESRIAVLHPGGSLATKRWPAAGFGEVALHLRDQGLTPVAVVGAGEESVRDSLVSAVPPGALVVLGALALSEVVALAALGKLFVGNDSGVAHIAAAVGTPAVVIFTSSNIVHWRPWASAPSEVVRRAVPCAPCPGYTCGGPVHLACVAGVAPQAVIAAAQRVLGHTTAEA
jgi:lipopolysaccharide heptosyltransferase II